MSESCAIVLLVDDNPEDRDVYRRYLADEYHVLEAERGAQALALCRDHRPACLLLDYRLPDGDGLTWLRHLQAEQRALAPPVIILTGTDNAALAVTLLHQGAEDYLVKGQLTPERLCHAVRRALQTAELRRRLAAHQRQVQERETRLHLVLEASATGLWEWNLATDAVIWSPECYAIHGLREGAFDGTAAGFNRLVHAEDQARVWAAVRGAAAHRTRYACEFRIVRPDGEVRWVANVGRAVYDAAGRPTWMIGTITDITERTWTQRALQQTRDLLHTVLQHVPSAILVTDAAGRFALTNPAVERMLGGPPTGDASGPVSGYRLSKPDGTPFPPEGLPLVRALRGEASADVELLVQRSDGVQVLMLAAATPMRAPAGTFTGAVAVLHDITARRQAEAALRELNATLEQRVAERTAALAQARIAKQRLEQEARRAEHFALLGRLAAGVSHELRNPLGAVFLNVDLLEEELHDLPPEAAAGTMEALAEIRAQLMRVEDLMEDYLSLVRVGALECAVQDLGAALQMWATEFQALAVAQGMALQTEGLVDLGPVAFHANTLRRALLNLVQNGLEAMTPGGTLTLRGHRTADQVVLEVADTGVGIPADRLPRLFEPLHTTRPGGTGLGLYIVQEVLVAHSGQVTVASVVGQGTTFTLTLPRAPRDDGVAAAVPALSSAPVAPSRPAQPSPVRRDEV
ncbi:MAG: ATP-binding protein [Candidatus Tectimicrobiota bacterium]